MRSWRSGGNFCESGVRDWIAEVYTSAERRIVSFIMSLVGVMDTMSSGGMALMRL